MKNNQTNSRPWSRISAVAGVLGILGGAASGQPVTGAPLPPGFKPTGNMDGSECPVDKGRCDASSETFKGPNGQKMARLSVKTGEVWNVCEILNGQAYAYPLQAPGDRTQISPKAMEKVERDTDKMDPEMPVADPAADAIDEAVIAYDRCRPRPGPPIS